MKNLYFRILTRPCFTRVGIPLASNPDLLSFCTQYANDFANPANPVFIPVFPFLNKQWWRGGGGRGVKCEKVESMFNKNSHRYGPAQTLFVLTHYTATKNSFTLLEITIGQDKLYGWSAHKAIHFL